ncbi:MAG: radical SAM protein [Bacteroidales bacterium]|nr:radical SAM protein [Bacteroidales bacterium]
MEITERQRLRKEAFELKLRHRGQEVFFRGLIEISNRCRKNCLYCGIRGGNHLAQRYEMQDEEVLREAQFALDAGYGSIALQGGERTDSTFVEHITRLVHKMRHLQPGGEGVPGPELNTLGITLSLGEQSREVYRAWKDAGASRYLLRIEASNKELYEKLHPGFRYTSELALPCEDKHTVGESVGSDMRGAGRYVDGDSVGSDIEGARKFCREEEMHSYERRVQALLDLKSEGYLLGSGVMIGLPFQTYANLDEDLQFLKELEVDMVGMGPFIPHKDTPLGQIVSYWKDGSACGLPDNLKVLASLPRGDFWNMGNEDLLELCIDMVARLRIMMPHINIAATTALQVLDPYGREKALMAGANVIMPNMTETSLRGNYSLYEGKQGVADDAESTRDKLLDNLSRLGIPVGWNLKGDWR